MWKNAADMLTSYSDEQFVSESYARELTGARTQAIEVERVSDDPPERIGGWVTSVGSAEVRALDLRLLLDLLTIEADPERWQTVTTPVVSHIEDLLLVGDFEGAFQLTTILTTEASRRRRRKPAAAAALARLADSAMMTHVVTHLRSVDECGRRAAAALCYMVGPSIVKGLAETLANENARLPASDLRKFSSASARPERTPSSSSARRRTRPFGGPRSICCASSAARGAARLDDPARRREPHVQREAVRAILSIGTEEAYAELQRALAKGSTQTREVLTTALVSMRSERAIPLFEYIVQKLDRKGPLRSVYLQAVESLGALKAEHTVDLLKDALYAGEWWAPFRTAELRRTVATALRQIGTPEAEQASAGTRQTRVPRRACRRTGGAIMIDQRHGRSCRMS